MAHCWSIGGYETVSWNVFCFGSVVKVQVQWNAEIVKLPIHWDCMALLPQESPQQ